MAEVKIERIRELDGWRAISIILVIFHHCVIYAYPRSSANSRILAHLGWHAGELGVRTFFVISGFVITRLLIREERQNGCISIRAFYIRRFFRIIPVFYLFLGVVAVLVAFGILLDVGWKDGVGAAAFLGDTKIRPQHWFTGHTWTLALEEQFYLILPAFWILSKRRFRVPLLLASLGIFLMWSMLVQYGLLIAWFWASTITGFGCINVGVLAAIFETRVRQLAVSFHPLIVVFLALFLFAFPLPDVPLANALYVLVAPFLIAVVLMHTASKPGLAAALLNSRLVQWVGLLSYSTYVWQQIFTAPAELYSRSWASEILHSPIIGILIVIVSFYLVERPANRLGRALTRPGTKVAPMLSRIEGGPVA